MPYTQCPSCRLSTFTPAGHSTREDCPRCGPELAARPRRPFAVAVDTARLVARVRELEAQLRRERSHSEGLARGVSALSERVEALRMEQTAQQAQVARRRAASASN